MLQKVKIMKQNIKINEINSENDETKSKKYLDKSK